MGAEYPRQIFKDAVMGVGTILSLVVDTIKCSDGYYVSLEIVSTGTPTGVYTVEGSNQYDAATNPNAVFTQGAVGTSPAFPTPAGAGAQTVHAVGMISFGACRFMRLRYVGSGGAGVLNVWAFPRA